MTVTCPLCGGAGEVENGEPPDHRPIWVALAVVVLLLEETEDEEAMLRSEVRDHLTVQLGLPTSPRKKSRDGEPTGPNLGRQDTIIVSNAIVQLDRWGLVHKDEQYVWLRSRPRAEKWVTATRASIARDMVSA